MRVIVKQSNGVKWTILGAFKVEEWEEDGSLTVDSLNAGHRCFDKFLREQWIDVEIVKDLRT